MIWEPFAMAVVLGLAMSAGLYFAYLWPSVEPDEEDEDDAEADFAAPANPPRDTAEPADAPPGRAPGGDA